MVGGVYTMTVRNSGGLGGATFGKQTHGLVHESPSEFVCTAPALSGARYLMNFHPLRNARLHLVRARELMLWKTVRLSVGASRPPIFNVPTFCQSKPITQLYDAMQLFAPCVDPNSRREQVLGGRESFSEQLI